MSTSHPMTQDELPPMEEDNDAITSTDTDSALDDLFLGDEGQSGESSRKRDRSPCPEDVIGSIPKRHHSRKRLAVHKITESLYTALTSREQTFRFRV